ncbi:hypothetical protein M1R94_20160, partial [Actinotalea sp. K2]|nr:hypothetical protein [Actinotalea sp. K2]
MQHHQMWRAVAAGSVLSMAVTLGAGVAHAEPGPTEFEEIAAAVTMAQPDNEDGRSLLTADNAASVLDVAGRDVHMDLEGGVLQVGATGVASDALASAVTLPPELGAHQSQVVDGEQAVFVGEEASATVQVLGNGVQITTVTSSASAPHSFTYEFEGVTPVLQADGTASMEYAAIEGITFTLGALEAPWAFDAEGVAVPTHYVVSGSTVTQVNRPGFRRGSQSTEDESHGSTEEVPG